eukprot:2417672-Amphidinium_carterae.1
MEKNFGRNSASYETVQVTVLATMLCKQRFRKKQHWTSATIFVGTHPSPRHALAHSACGVSRESHAAKQHRAEQLTQNMPDLEQDKHLQAKLNNAGGGNP